MRFVDELREPSLCRDLAAHIRALVAPGRRYRLMEFCGGHTHALCRFGLLDLLPPEIEMVHGPGCPVCVLPIGRLEQAIELAGRPGVLLCSYGDMMRVPGRDRRSLLRARAQGAAVRMVLGVDEALSIARAEPRREVVFFAIGFETTTPATAFAVRQAAREGLGNFSVLCNHVLTPSAITALLCGEGAPRLDGLVGPGHVSAVTGIAPYHQIARDHRVPIVISGFEPLDLLQSIAMLVAQIDQGRHDVETQYTRAVSPEGNRKAQALVDEVLEPRDVFAWRGLGLVPRSALRLRDAFAAHDAERRFSLPEQLVADHPACDCADVLRGKKRPSDCKLFAVACTPDEPLGACMVSSEGACAAYFRHGSAP